MPSRVLGVLGVNLYSSYLATGVVCVPSTLLGELDVNLYRQFCPQGRDWQELLVVGHRKSPWGGRG
jgi:hypothetical protein